MFALSRYSLSETLTSKRWILRYTAVISPEGSKNVEVLDNRSEPGSPSRIEPQQVHAELARQIAHKLRHRTGDRLGVLTVDFIEAVATPELRQRHEIGTRGHRLPAKRLRRRFVLLLVRRRGHLDRRRPDLPTVHQTPPSCAASD